MAEGDFVTSWDVSGEGITQAVGITSDGTNLFIIDRDNDTVDKYTTAGSPVASWNLAGANNSPQTIGTDGTNIWVSQWQGTTLYQYNMDGTADGTITLGHAGNTQPLGIAIFGGKMYCQDLDNNLYKYSDLAGSADGSFSTSSKGSNNGATTDGTNIWTVNITNEVINKWTIGGTWIDSWSLNVANTDPRDIAYDSGTDRFYVTDPSADKVFVYEAELITGTNMQINIADVWKDVDSIQINIGDVWKDVDGIQINIGDAWKTIF